MKSRISPLLFASLLAASTVAADTPKQLSLAECLRIAEAKHPDLLSAQALVDMACTEIKAAHSNYLPRVDSGVSYTRQTYNFAATPGTAPRQVSLFSAGQSSATAPYYFAGLNLSQLIYDFGQTRGSVNRAEADYSTAQQNLKRTHDLIYLNVRVSYYGVLAAEELLQARKDNVANQRKHLEQVTAFHDVGTRPKIDVTKQEVATASAEVDLRQAEENLQVAKAALATAMGIPIAQAPEPVNTLNEVPNPGTLEPLMAEAEKQRPDVEALRDRIFAADADMIVARSAFRPNINLSGFFNYRNLQLPLIYNWGLGSLVAQTFFEGGARRAHFASAQAEERAAKANLESLLQKVRQEVFTRYSDLQVAKDKISLNQKAASEAKENLALAEGRYQAGYGNIIELTDAQSLLTDSEVQEIVSRFDYQTAAANLDVAVGRTPIP